MSVHRGCGPHAHFVFVMLTQLRDSCLVLLDTSASLRVVLISLIAYTFFLNQRCPPSQGRASCVSDDMFTDVQSEYRSGLLAVFSTSGELTSLSIDVGIFGCAHATHGDCSLAPSERLSPSGLLLLFCARRPSLSVGCAEQAVSVASSRI